MLIFKRILRVETFFLLMLLGLTFGIYVPNFMLEEQLSYKQRHASIEQTINNQIKLFEKMTQKRPRKMTTKEWSSRHSLGIKYFFPDGVPTHCPNGYKWEIDVNKGLLVPHHNHM